VTFTYQKIEQNDLALKDWKRYLEQAEKTVFESELEDFQWYAVHYMLSYNWIKLFNFHLFWV
jgi:nitrous oxidase accessory protein NosD